MNELKLQQMLKYLETLSEMYFEGDPLNIKPSIDRAIHLIETEFNKCFETED